MKILIETALLGHGLPSITSDTIKKMWQDYEDTALVWLENGKIKLGKMDEFLKVREKKDWKRISRKTLEDSIRNLESGFLTASAVMKIAYESKIDIVVTAGMGGIRKDTFSDDLYCLMEYPLMLIASSPKDTLDIEKTIGFLQKNGVKVMGYNTNIANGFIFKSNDILIDGINKVNDYRLLIGKKGTLLLNPVTENERIKSDSGILLNAIDKGENDMENFHPTVNFYLDKYTDGVASMLQLKAMIANLYVAYNLV